MRTIQASEAVCVRVGERLDSPEVAGIERLLAEAVPDVAVVLDFRETRSFGPVPLAQLARDLLASDRRISVRGLSEYHYRLLRYAGATRGAGADPAAGPRWV